MGTREGWIGDFAIEPAHRRRGYGREALGALEQLVRADGCSRISLHVLAHNHGARALYEQMGYRPTNLVLERSLSEATAGV